MLETVSFENMLAKLNNNTENFKKSWDCRCHELLFRETLVTDFLSLICCGCCFFCHSFFFVPSEDVCKRISSLKFLYYYFGMVSTDLVALCLSYVIPCLL